MIKDSSYSRVRGKIFDIAIRKKAKKTFDDIRAASLDPQKYTGLGLRRILDYAKDTEYGKKYNFTYVLQAKDDDELYKRYEENVPIIDYKDIEQYIVESARGKTNLLLPEKPKMYFKTSGTTGKQKLLPASSYLLDSVVTTLNLMISSYAHKRRDVFNSKILGITDPPPSDRVEDGTLLGSVSGYNRANMSDFAKSIYSVPEEVYLIPDYDARYYLIMRFSVEYDLGMIVTANPSTIVELINNSKMYYDDYCSDIENGIINNKLNIPDDLRKSIESYVKPNPKRAAFLRDLKDKLGNQTPLPKDYWPHFRVLLTWKLGNCEFYTRDFGDWFPKDICHLEFGYFSSECRFGPVLEGDDGTIIMPQWHYIEFIDIDDIENNQPKSYRIYELEEGKKYCPIVSTLSGLYRYNMNDIIITSNKYFNMPRIKFYQKTGGIVSLTGEKLSEHQFMASVDKVCSELNISVVFYSGFANLDCSRYDLYFEFADPNIKPEDKRTFLTILDKCLQESNIEYSSKRNSLRLKEPVLYTLPKNSYEYIKKEIINKGGSDGQYKLSVLAQNDERKRLFDKISLMEK